MKRTWLGALALTFAAAAGAATPGPCDRFVGKLPNVTKALCEQARLIDSGARSVQGSPLYVRDVKAQDARLRVLVVGAIHGAST
ncbi:MAG: murein peptide amidase [Ramlibacter sp.]|nr:murein peptide amidase [Ramlibacter sp.]